MIMLKGLSHYDNLGSPRFFFELFQLLAQPAKHWTKKSINDYFYNRLIDDKVVFDGCLPLIESIGVITKDNHGSYKLHPTFKPLLKDEKSCADKLLEMIILAATKDTVFNSVFDESNISYDIVYHLIQVDFAAFDFKYSNFRNLLLSFGFLQLHPNPYIHKYTINSCYKHLFNKLLVKGTRHHNMSMDELKKILNHNEILGREAEKYVLDVEKTRLIAHPALGNIKIISDYDVSAGYDIISYETSISKGHDKFIEVKSYADEPNFHWSRKEIDVARIKKEQYYLYLVDRNQINNKLYAPLIIKNPYLHIIQNPVNWNSRIEEYYITKSK